MNYERLTQWTPQGASLILGDVKTTEEAAQKLKEQFKKACNRLAELEDKLESGELVELPCKVGDPIYTVYLDDDYEYKIVETECIGFNIRGNEVEIITNFCCYDPYRYGKFTDNKAAEARLKELQEGKK